jgi:hypothetical protein
MKLRINSSSPSGCLIPFFFLAVAFAFGYFANIYKLTQLDFEEPYKAEIIRGVGLFPPVGIFAGYMTFDEEKNK